MNSSFILGSLIGIFVSTAAVITLFLTRLIPKPTVVFIALVILLCLLGFTILVKRAQRKPDFITGLYIGLVSGPLLGGAYTVVTYLLVLIGVDM